jgi:hypothetical protein
VKATEDGGNEGISIVTSPRDDDDAVLDREPAAEWIERGRVVGDAAETHRGEPRFSGKLPTRVPGTAGGHAGFALGAER